jgi:hypothetical protein
VGGVAGMINNELKFSQTLKKIGDILTIIMPIFSVGYFFWVRNDIPLVFYVSNYREISFVGALLLSVGSIFTIFALIYARPTGKSGIRIVGIILFALTFPFNCLLVYVTPTLQTVLDKAQISNTTYYLTGEINLDGHFFRHLYKCTNNYFACEKTPFYSGGGTSVQRWSLMIDKTIDPNEINVIVTYFDGTALLEYTYGTQSRNYDYPAQLNNRWYYLAYSENPTYATTIFTFYECKLDNTSCKKLPILYQGTGRFRDTIADEVTGEISVFIGNEFDKTTLKSSKMLIFTWGENPRCYVEGCEILEETK